MYVQEPLSRNAQILGRFSTPQKCRRQVVVQEVWNRAGWTENGVVRKGLPECCAATGALAPDTAGGAAAGQIPVSVMRKSRQ